MSSRQDFYYSDRGLKIRREGADGKMLFTVAKDCESMERSSRGQLCIVYDLEDIEDLPNDSVLVLLQQEENILLFLEKWKLYYLDALNIEKTKKGVRVFIPYKEFKSIGGHSWVAFDGANVTWSSIADMVNPDPVPNNLGEQIPLFTHAISESGQ